MTCSSFVRQCHASIKGITGLVLAVLFAFGAAEATAQTGSVTGVVQDAVSLRPLAGAQVAVEGTGIGQPTNNVGRFLLLNVPAGEHTISATLIGYGTVSQTITVDAGESTVVNLNMRQEAISLEGVVVTGTAGAARRREIGNQISQIDSEAIDLSAVTDIGDILQGRATGVQINDFGGQVGGTSQIRLRGNNTILSNDPLIYVDGVRIENGVIGVDDEAASSPSVLDMINPNDIERIEIVKGPAATTLYGTEAAGGVIQIFTKRGSAGAPAWTLSVDQGFRDMPHQSNSLNPESINPTGFYLNDCSVRREYDADADRFVTINERQLGCPESGSWFQKGHLQRYNLSVRGGNQDATYFVSGRYEDEEGVVDPQGAQSYGLRANVAFQPFDGLDVRVNSNYQHREITWIPDGNNASGFLLNVLRGTAGYTPNNDDSKVFENDLLSNIEVYQLGATVQWAPNTMWNHSLNLGMDYTVHDWVDWKHWDYYAEPTGSRENDHDQDRNLTVDYNGSFNYSPFEDISSRLSFGGQLYEEFNYGLFGFDSDFAGPGEPQVGDGTNPSVTEGRTRVRSGGFFLQEQIGWQDRLFLTGGVRWDGFSTFGEGFGLATYPKLSGSWVVSEESFFPFDVVDQLKLRAAWGESGKAPGIFAAEKLWSATVADEQQPAVVLASFGNEDLGPEKSTELELGFDLSAWNGRVALEFTHYDQKTTDALLGVSPTPSSGTDNSILRNIGRVDNWGTETALTVIPVSLPEVEWSLGVQYTTNDSEVVDLGPLEDIGSTIQVGYPLRIRFDDVLITCEPYDADPTDDVGPVVPDPCWNPNDAFDPANPPRLEDRIIGPLFPTEILSLSTRLTLWQSLTLDLLGEGQYGHVKAVGPAYQNMRRTTLSNPVWPYCAPIINTWENGDRTSLTNKQVTECIQRYSDQGVWSSKADFFKLRSATLSWRLPQEWVPQARSVQLTLQGKNLWTSTDYFGLDPEAGDNGASDSTPNDYYTFGPPRVFILGVRVNF